MLLRLNQMRHRHTTGVQVTGSRSESNSEDSYPGDDEAGRRVRGGKPRKSRQDTLRWHDTRFKRMDDGKVEVKQRRGDRTLRLFVRPNLGPAATHLLHAGAFPCMERQQALSSWVFTPSAMQASIGDAVKSRIKIARIPARRRMLISV